MNETARPSPFVGNSGVERIFLVLSVGNDHKGDMGEDTQISCNVQNRVYPYRVRPKKGNRRKVLRSGVLVIPFFSQNL